MSCPGCQILIVDDDVSICQILRRILESENYEIKEAHSGNEALSLFKENEIDLVLLDFQLPDITGIDVAKDMIAQKPLVPIVLISAYATISKAVEATKMGVYDFLEKPLDRDRITVTIRNALAYGQMQKQLEYYKQDCFARFKMIGQSPQIRYLFAQIERIAPSNTHVLILGENGVGKELVAEAIHCQSHRATRPLVKINCAAIPDNLLESELFGHTKGAFTGANIAKKGRFETADKGTLFLDEIGDLSLAAQAKLLRFLESGEIQRVGSSEIAKVDVRLIAASNKNLKQMVAEKTFREDLYFRLEIFTITVPPLRERRSDIPLLLDFFISNHAEATGVSKPSISPAAIKYLTNCDWPGNIRQLRNFVERLMIMHQGDLIDLNDVISLIEPNESAKSPTIDETKPLQQAREDFEREYILRVLEEHDWKIAKAAEVLHIDRANLYRKMRGLGITVH
ncbi:MAG: sigma-54 dependent transcriptional regulator [candidate division KSB1 bacterium]|nr:sigma-54 dependent transcriptional regulator [candidate division KSB1 bacterium]MDZ7358832.1 sigma-54 dependent transcriptional regulator [candidate division KSB1 bacterium]MDZ7376210.1 sigma-54 dependent transcriptional regulator [candidate division KSB1 bacterium]MDZ7399746.1 sigma-54 dependent transcriptional regulator [candidate division KSB1 bacterium]